MIRSTFKRPLSPRREREPDEFATFIARPRSAEPTLGQRLRAAEARSVKPFPAPKDTPHYSEAWRRAVAELPCVLCGKHGTQASHRNEGKALGRKTDDCLTAALCPEHHREIDQGSTMTRDDRRREMDRAILRTLVILFRQGKARIA